MVIFYESSKTLNEQSITLLRSTNEPLEKESTNFQNDAFFHRFIPRAQESDELFIAYWEFSMSRKR